ncbi:MAG: carbohydrate ABC transporter permease [Caldilinea sp. CFX5]|nr:carbohydrate ABC transporter permease [Caldilinea sp. CFX5]
MSEAERLTKPLPTIQPSAHLGLQQSAQTRHLLYLTAMQVILIAGSAVMLIPFVWLISTSLKIRGTEFTFPPVWIPRPAVWGNYYKAFFDSGLPFPRFLLNTTIITVASMIGTLFSASLAGFGFARMRFPGRDKLFVLVLATLMLPEIVTTIPSYLLFRVFGWIDTFLPLIVPSFLGGGAFNIFLFRQFFMTIPYELDEAARIDGAGTRQIYLRVILPLAKPVLTTVAIFTFLSSWNSFLGPLIYLNSLEKMTLAVGLRAFQGLRGTEWNLMMAAAATMMAPVLIVFFLAQRYFVEGIVTTGFGGR